MKIPTSDPSVTTRVHAAAALRQLERLRREVDAASAAVTIVLGANSRDTAAEISRATGRSNRQGRRDAQTAQAVETLPAAGEALANVEVSAEHVAMLGITGLLPPVEGARLRAELEAIADRAYRAAHPERAEHRGGHHEEPLAARLADALVSLVNNEHDTGTGTGSDGGDGCGDDDGDDHHFLHDNNLYVDRQPGQRSLIRRKTDGSLCAGP